MDTTARSQYHRVMISFAPLILALSLRSALHQETQKVQVTPGVTVTKYLLDLRFEGVYLGDINLTKKPRAKASKTTKPSVRATPLPRPILQ